MEAKALYIYLGVLGALVLLGLFIGLYLASDTDYIKPLPQPMQHYTDKRDQMSTPQPVATPAAETTPLPEYSTECTGMFYSGWMLWVWIIALGAPIIYLVITFTRGGFDIGRTVGMIIMGVVAINIFPPLLTQVCPSVQTNTTSTEISALKPVMDILPLAMIIALAIVPITMIIGWWYDRD